MCPYWIHILWYSKCYFLCCARRANYSPLLTTMHSCVNKYADDLTLAVPNFTNINNNNILHFSYPIRLLINQKKCHSLFKSTSRHASPIAKENIILIYQGVVRSILQYCSVHVSEICLEYILLSTPLFHPLLNCAKIDLFNPLIALHADLILLFLMLQKLLKIS